MVKEGEALAALNPQIVVKLPMIADGIKACKYFSYGYPYDYPTTLGWLGLANQNQYAPSFVSAKPNTRKAMCPTKQTPA